MISNTELLLTGYEAWNRDDCDAWLKLLDPDVEIRTSGVFPDLAAEYHGHGPAAKFWRQMHDPWAVFRIDVEDIAEEDDLVWAAIRFRGRGGDSGAEVDMRFGHAIRVRDGRAIEFVTRRTVEEARSALRFAGPAVPSGRPDRQAPEPSESGASGPRVGRG